MIRRLTAAAVFVLCATAAFAQGSEAVLTPDGTVYTVSAKPAAALELVRRFDDERTSVLVPTTDDVAIESDARLLWDGSTSTLYVVWHRSGQHTDQIVVARLYDDGTWSDPTLVATGSSVTRAGLTAVLTHARVDDTHTAALVHAAWWSMGADPVAEYALIAFEGREHVSTSVSDLASLAGITESGVDLEIEVMAPVEHPPLAISREDGGSVDVVFGSPKSTGLTRVVLDPKLGTNARLWKPSRKGGGRTPRAGIQSATGDPVRALLSRGRIVLYTPDKRFRFVLFDNGTWSPERVIQLDEHLTSEQVVQELRRTVEQLDGEAAPPSEVIE